MKCKKRFDVLGFGWKITFKNWLKTYIGGREGESSTELSITDTSSDFVQSMDFSGPDFCLVPDFSLDRVWTKFKTKIENFRNENLKKKEKMKIWKNQNLKNWKLRIFKFLILRFIEISFFSFQFQLFNFKNKIWILSKPSPNSNLVLIWSRQNPDLSLN